MSDVIKIYAQMRDKDSDSAKWTQVGTTHFMYVEGNRVMDYGKRMDEMESGTEANVAESILSDYEYLEQVNVSVTDLDAFREEFVETIDTFRNDRKYALKALGLQHVKQPMTNPVDRDMFDGLDNNHFSDFVEAFHMVTQLNMIKHIAEYQGVFSLNREIQLVFVLS